MATPGSVRIVLERLAADGTVVARSDGSTHQVFPVAVSMGEGQALSATMPRADILTTLRYLSELRIERRPGSFAR